MKVRTRIAPSPTGSPHIGTAYAALFNYCFARKNSGQFVLRIEDTDRTRFVEGSEKEMIDALSWLGLPTDENPEKGGSFGPYRQSERLEIYKENLETLIDAGKAYYCNCSADRLDQVRKDQQAKGEMPRYDRKCRFDPPAEKTSSVVRLAIPLDGETIVEDEIRGKIEFQNKILDDQVLLKSDSFPTYHLASVIDDHLMEISHVIRAEEWLSSTPKHVLLYQAFGWEIPKFAHLPLLRNPDKSKISKRKNPVSIDFYKTQGYLPEALVNFLALMGWSMPEDKEIFTLNEMVKEFSFDRIDPSGPVFDTQKLEWLNGHYIRSLSSEELTRRLVEGGFTEGYSDSDVKKVLPLVKERLKKLSEFKSLAGYFIDDKVEVSVAEVAKLNGFSTNESFEVLEKIDKALEEITEWSSESIEKTLNQKQVELEWNKTKLFQTIRYVLTGSTTTPPLGETIEAIGKEKTQSRIKEALNKLKQAS